MHWGTDLGATTPDGLVELANALVPAVSPSSIDAPLRLSLLPLASEGWTGTPGLAGFRPGGDASGGAADPSFALTSVDTPDPGSVLLCLEDRVSRLAMMIGLQLDDHGVLELSSSITNKGDGPWHLAQLAVTLPVPPRAREILDFSGRWAFERRPQRQAFERGTWTRDSRHGRTGHDSPFLLSAGTPGFGYRHGEVWAIHLAWSGDQTTRAESHPTGHALLSAAELLQPGEVTLAPGDSYHAPAAIAVYSADGLDGISARLHARTRRRHPLPPRPVVLNTWEAVYFEHDQSRLTGLAEIAASVGVERFVLDDGWMTGRTDDQRALGDWTVDPQRWPSGLHPLVDRVNELGMDFGLWVEPEMVSLDSQLARAHPEWVLRGSPDTLPRPWRHQYALDLDNPLAFENIRAQLSRLLDEYPIAFLKWDQNRDLLGGSTRRQTLACYRLMDELRMHHPGLEIESCSSGGARIDLGVVEHTDRVWTSDTNDPLERQAIQRHTSLLLPPEWLGSHLGAPVAHITGRAASLSFRLATALFWSAGIEWDLGSATVDDLVAIRAWTSAYIRLRGLLHSGTVVRADAPDPAIEVHGVVASDRSSAVFAVVSLGAARDAVPAAVLFPGLDPGASYRVAPIAIGAEPRFLQDTPPPWFARGGVVLSGTALGGVGLPMPVLAPQQALVLGFERT